MSAPADLPNTPLADLDWNLVTGFRLLTIFVIVLFTLQMSTLLSHYWHRVIPMRRELDSRHHVSVLAPPIRWTFAYHATVMVIVVLIAIGMAQNIANEAPPTLFTFVAPLLIAALTVIVNRFMHYYSDVLNRGFWQRR